MAQKNAFMSFLHSIILRHHLVVPHGQHFRVLWQLMINVMHRLRLRFYKWLHGIHTPIVHYYALCWNEERILPFVLDYYGRFCQRLTFYDNGSTDDSLALIASYPNTRIVPYTSRGIEDEVYRHIKNTCWKQSRGKADWVIVCDMDEFLFHPQLVEALADATHQHISFPDIEGFEMYAEKLPPHIPGTMITEQIRRGVRSQWLDKHILFNPNRIVDINYAIGAHNAQPIGSVSTGAASFKLLHYKNIDLKFLIDRYALLASRLSETNRRENYGGHYRQAVSEIESQFYVGMSQAADVVK